MTVVDDDAANTGSGGNCTDAPLSAKRFRTRGGRRMRTDWRGFMSKKRDDFAERLQAMEERIAERGAERERMAAAQDAWLSRIETLKAQRQPSLVSAER